MNNEDRRFFYQTDVTADKFIRANKLLYWHTPRVWISYGMVLAFGIAAPLWLYLMLGEWSWRFLIPSCICLIYFPFMFIFLWFLWRRRRAQFMEMYPDGKYTVTSWVENGHRYVEMNHQLNSDLELSSFARMYPVKEMMFLRTKQKLHFFADRDAFSDADWQALAERISEANPAFKYKLK